QWGGGGQGAAENKPADAVLPDVPLQHLEELLRALGAEADHARELSQDGTVKEGLGHGPKVASTVDKDLHVLVVARLQLDIDENVGRGLIGEEGLQAGQGTVVVANTEEEGLAVEEGAGKPDAAQDAMLLEEGIEEAASPCSVEGTDRQTIIANRDQVLSDAG